MAERIGWVAALGLGVVFGLQVWLGSQSESPTWDEPGYVAAGYANWTGDYRLNADHPPLLQKLQALPLFWLPVRVPSLAELQWEGNANPRANQGYRLFFESGNDPVQLTRWSRAPVLLLGLTLVLCLYACARQLLGAEPALLVCALASFDPNLLAHAKLATEDLGCAALMFAAVWTYLRWLEAPSLRRALVCGAVTGLALVSKYTALLLLPIDLGLTAILWWRQRPAVPIASLARHLAALAGAALLVINFSYGFGFHLDRYAAGVFGIYPELATDYHHYFWGQVSDSPFRYYATASLLIKTPLSLWLLLALGAYGAIRSRERLAWALLLPAFVVLAVSWFDPSSPGARRVLPALPFLLLFTGFAIRPPVHTALRAAAWILVLASAVEAARIYPHHLSYLNPLFGGPANGPYVLDESNIDWGQDLPALGRWQAEHSPDAPLRFWYFGNADPAAYGVDAVGLDIDSLEHPAPGYVAMSAHYLVFLRKLQAVSGRDIDWLTKYEPVAKAGHSIWIYRFDP